MRNITFQTSTAHKTVKLLLDLEDTGVLISLKELEHRRKLFGLTGTKVTIDIAMAELNYACQLTDEERAYYSKTLRDFL